MLTDEQIKTTRGCFLRRRLMRKYNKREGNYVVYVDEREIGEVMDKTEGLIIAKGWIDDNCLNLMNPPAEVISC